MSTAPSDHAIDKVLNQWVRDYSEDLFHVALSQTRQADLSRDLVQACFLSAYKGYDGFRQESTAKTWLISILNRGILDHYRELSRKPSSQHMPQAAVDKALSSLTDMGAWDMNAEVNQRKTLSLDHGHLEECMSQLPDLWHFAITERLLKERKSSEICQELGITASNYWQIIHRAKMALRNCLKQQGIQ
jgi:RNA polymerase sigma-70 factor (ECF subfamily)